MSRVTTATENIVAIIEDDEGMRNAIRRVLEGEGYATLPFASAEEFLAAQAPCFTKCLVLDVHLPGMSGIELMRRLRAVKHAIPTIVISGRDLPVRDAESMHEDCSLAKPFAPESLIQAVQRCLPSTKNPDAPRA